MPARNSCNQMYDLKTFLPSNYRTDLSSVKWEDSVVVFGCSMVYGVGLEEFNSLTFHLSRLLKCPVVNMGVNGSSMNFSLHNQLVLHKSYPRPKAVINIWTEYSRSSYYNRDYISNYDPWNITLNSYGDIWTKDPAHSKTQAIMTQHIARTLWKDIPYYEATFFRETEQLLGCDLLLSHANESDYADDGIHPGPVAIHKSARFISKRARFKFS